MPLYHYGLALTVCTFAWRNQNHRMRKELITFRTLLRMLYLIDIWRRKLNFPNTWEPNLEYAKQEEILSRHHANGKLGLARTHYFKYRNERSDFMHFIHNNNITHQYHGMLNALCMKRIQTMMEYNRHNTRKGVRKRLFNALGYWCLCALRFGCTGRSSFI